MRFTTKIKINGSKYGNKKVVYNGIAFDSIREKDRYIFLKEAEDNGVIRDLQLQTEFLLLPKQCENVIKHLKTKDKIVEKVIYKKVTYKADFTYYKDDEYIVEDVKISKRLLPKEFTLKVKMMYYFHHINVKCVFKPKEPV